MPQNCFLATLLTWSLRRWVAAALGGVGTFLLIGLSTAVIGNPVFGRSIPPTAWSMNVLIATSVLSGLLMATYVRNSGPALVRAAQVDEVAADPRNARRGAIGGLLAYFAVGCPVCNKLALIALGSTGAVQYFAPVQPYLAAAGLLALVWALVVRLRGEMTCAFGTGRAAAQPAVDEQDDQVLAGARELFRPERRR